MNRGNPKLALCSGLMVSLLVAASPGQTASAAVGMPREHDQTFALLWMQRAAEHHALCRQVFRSAQLQLDKATEDPSWTACLEQRAAAVQVEGQFEPLGLADLPLAVVADVDETALDNTPYNARLIEDGDYRFDPKTWTAWVEERQALPIPGALGFFAEVQRRGITVFWVTNRTQEEEAATRDNLRMLGFPVIEGDVDVVLTRGEYGDVSADKGGRRARVAATHRVLLMLGDDLNDFLSGTRARLSDKEYDAASVARDAAAVEVSRARRVEDLGDWWGSRWFMLPNPLYGSWEGLLRRQSADLLALQRTQRQTEKAGAKLNGK